MAVTLSEVLAHDVRHHADKVAVTLDDRGLTYAQLARSVEEARRFLAPHVGPGDRVALWLPNSFAWIAAFLALASLKAVSVPVNTRLTTSELAVILDDAEVRVVLADPAYRGRDYVAEACETRAARLPTVISASDASTPNGWTLARSGARPWVSSPMDAPDVFCIQYTSGTTSTPKGVMLTEALYLQTARHVVRCQMLTPNRSFMSAAPFFHCSGSMHAITCTLLAGCSLHSVTAWDPEYFLSLIARHRGETGHGVFFRDIVALGAEKARGPLSTMKVAYDIGGPDFVRRLHGEFGITGICNIYGMTETGGNFTMWFPDDDLDRRIVLNGRPQVGNRIRIVDPASGAVLGPDQQGEIQMKGATLTPGYYRRPEANAAAFTADGWFRSGDLGTLNADNELHFIARLRDIVRVGGENVSPVEVELAVQVVTGLKEFSVIGVPDPRLGEVVALVVLDAAADGDWKATQGELAKRLAGFKLPRHVYAAATMPMTATNKVQRATLQKWAREGRLRRIV
ncbi:MAG: acyl--CoA ligase [Alphaproteobacteria bacterium]|nr:acyl--CoA ligase [Alphaproteobacteria bacterium]